MEQAESNGRKIYQELHTCVAYGLQVHLALTILEALLKIYASSLNDENLRTLITQTEAVINSRPLTVSFLQRRLILHHLEHSRDKMSVPEEDDMFSTFLTNFGHNGGKNFSKCYK